MNPPAPACLYGRVRSFALFAAAGRRAAVRAANGIWPSAAAEVCRPGTAKSSAGRARRAERKRLNTRTCPTTIRPGATRFAHSNGKSFGRRAIRTASPDILWPALRGGG